jgi:hypothetical protein
MSGGEAANGKEPDGVPISSDATEFSTLCARGIQPDVVLAALNVEF